MASFSYYNQNPSGYCFLVQIKAFFYLNLTGITKFKYEREKMNSGLSSKKTSSCKKMNIPEGGGRTST